MNDSQKGLRSIAAIVLLLLGGASSGAADRAESAAASSSKPAASTAGQSNADTPNRNAEKPRFRIFPPTIRLDGAGDSQSYVAVDCDPDGMTSDVSDQVQWSIADPSVAKLDGKRVIPLADGTTQLLGRLNKVSLSVPVKVVQADWRQPIGFARDVIPVLTRAGCNSGSCHGASRGKDGFHLSLFGYDPAGDYYRITREMPSRRVNLAVPSESLLLRKSAGQVPHTGGKLMEVNSSGYQVLREWLADGATSDLVGENMPTVEALSVFPTEAVMQEATSQRFIAVAHYSDGTTRDVSQLASWSSSHDRQASVGDNAVVTAANRGETFVTARFDSHTVGAHVLTLPAELPPIQPATPPGDLSRIDRLIHDKLYKLRIPASPPCSDEEFLRRVTLDLTGLLPTRSEYDEFLADNGADKRSRWVDRLLERPEFDQIWSMKFAQLLMIRSTNLLSRKSALKYSQWLSEQFSQRVPLDQIATRLLTSSGNSFESPAVGFYQTERDSLKLSENVAQVFLGIRTQCAQCHNHPFDRWTIDDYYGFAAFFAQVGRKNGEDYRKQIIFDRRGGETRHPLTKKPVAPKFLGGQAPETRGKDRRQVLADWLIAPENPFFSRSMANRVWAHLMGVGVVDPVDDVRVSNPPSNPTLYDELGQRLIDHQYDLRSLVRDICNSQAYGRSSRATSDNEHDRRNYSHAVVRRLPAESLLDCISVVTGSPTKYPGLPLGARATEILDGATSNYFLTTFGRAPRTSACSCDASTEPSLSQALNLLNGVFVHNKVTGGKLVEKWIRDSKLSPSEIIDEIYIRCLTRKPTKSEREDLLASIPDDQPPHAALQDIFWAVLNSREFLFNH